MPFPYLISSCLGSFLSVCPVSSLLAHIYCAASLLETPRVRKGCATDSRATAAWKVFLALVTIIDPWDTLRFLKGAVTISLNWWPLHEILKVEASALQMMFWKNLHLLCTSYWHWAITLWFFWKPEISKLCIIFFPLRESLMKLIWN